MIIRLVGLNSYKPAYKLFLYLSENKKDNDWVERAINRFLHELNNKPYWVVSFFISVILKYQPEYIYKVLRIELSESDFIKVYDCAKPRVKLNDMYSLILYKPSNTKLFLKIYDGDKKHRYKLSFFEKMTFSLLNVDIIEILVKYYGMNAKYANYLTHDIDLIQIIIKIFPKNLMYTLIHPDNFNNFTSKIKPYEHGYGC